MADAATRLQALQSEREYILFRIRDLNNSEGDCLHPTGERRTLMAFFEQLNAKIRELVDEVLVEDEPGVTVRGAEVEDMVEGSMQAGVFTEAGAKRASKKNGQKVVVIFLKE